MTAIGRESACLEPLGTLAELYETAVAAGDFDRALGYLTRPYRIHQLEFWWTQGYLSLEQFRGLLPSVWVDTEFPHSNYRRALRLFRVAGFTTNNEDGWAALTDSLEIWRGTNHLRPKGLSWTLDHDLAVWFARRFAHGLPGYLLHGRILKRHVLGFCSERGEDEIVVNPANVRLLEVTDAYGSVEDASYARAVAKKKQEHDRRLERIRLEGMRRALLSLLMDLARVRSTPAESS